MTARQDAQGRQLSAVTEVIAIDTPSLGDRSYLAHDGTVAVVIDPQRDIDRVLDLAATAGVTITHVFETHLHNDYVTGGLALAEATGAAYHVNRADQVTFDRVPVSDGDIIEVSPLLRVRVLATPGHTRGPAPRTPRTAAGRQRSGDVRALGERPRHRGQHSRPDPGQRDGEVPGRRQRRLNQTEAAADGLRLQQVPITDRERDAAPA